MSIGFITAGSASGSSGGGVSLPAVTNITTKVAYNKVFVKWTDPDDVMFSGVTMAGWAGTLLVRKAGSEPTSRQDGTVVIDSKIRNQYKETYFCDSNVTNGITYYYKFFPYTKSKVYTDSDQDEFSATPKEVFVGNVSLMSAEAAGNGKLAVKWTDPDETVVDDGAVLAKWGNTKVVYNDKHYPTNVEDGTLAKTSTTRNEYANSPLIISGLTNGTLYYITFFPTTTDGAVTVNETNHVSGTPNKGIIETVPSQDGTLTYDGTTNENGSAQSPRWKNYEPTKLQLEVTPQQNAGKYKATFTPTDDYMWEEENSEPKQVDWEIKKKEIPKPTAEVTNLPYSDEPQMPEFEHYDEGAITIGGDSSPQTEAASYSTTFTPKSNFKWVDGESEVVTIEWKIGKVILEQEPSQKKELTYNGTNNTNGSAQTPDWDNYNDKYLQLEVTAQTNAGEYSAYFTPKKNCCWSDESEDRKEIKWHINKKSVDKPTADETDYTYDESPHIPTWTNYNADAMSMTGTTTEQTNAGNFTTTFTPYSNFQWTEGNSTPVVISWKIDKIAGSLEIDKQSITLNADHTSDTIKVTKTGDGEISVEEDVSDIVTTEIQGNVITVKSKDNATGTVHLTIKVAEGTNHTAPESKECVVNAEFMPAPGNPLESYTWDQLSQIAQSGNGDSYFDVGDVKSVVLDGKIGGYLTLSKKTLYVYILGFNSDKVGDENQKNIIFGTFLDAASSGKDVCLVDSNYNSSKTGGEKTFNMNHWGNYNYGGWKGCDMRYDILGSVEKAPSDYSKAHTANCTGYDATEAAKNSPVSDTLMAALPDELRKVLQPMTIYTDNYGNSSNVANHVTTSVDYLPLLAEFEIFGTRTYANNFEQNNQAQYDYYKTGNHKVKYQYNGTTTGSAASWWERSPYYGGANSFCFVGTNGGANIIGASYAYGLAPAFRI